MMDLNKMVDEMIDRIVKNEREEFEYMDIDMMEIKDMIKKYVNEHDLTEFNVDIMKLYKEKIVVIRTK